MGFRIWVYLAGEPGPFFTRAQVGSPRFPEGLNITPPGVFP